MARVQEHPVALATLQTLREAIRGEVIFPGDPPYDAARRVWNAMADRRPAVIVRCSGVADIMRSVSFAREQDLIIAVRGGGHSIPGFSTCDGGMVIDLGPMKGVLVDPKRQMAMVQSEGQDVCGVTSCYSGPIEDAEKVLQPLRENKTPHVDNLRPVPYLALQAGADQSFPPGQHHYTTSVALDELSDEAIEILAGQWDAAPTPHPWIVLEHMGGEISTPPPGGTAYAQRDAGYEASVWATWTDPSQTEAFVEWSRALPRALAPVSRRDSYVNYLDVGGQDAVRASYRGGYRRLQELKAKFDPNNVFRLNQNISPAPGLITR